ncbi:MAG: DNA-binding protein [Promethearchaeota archaeon]
MSYDDENDLSAIRQRRAEELKRQMEQQQAEEQVKAEIEQQRRAVLQKILEEPALDRLTNVRMVKPQLAQAVESQLIGLAQSGRLQSKITDKQLKSMLARLADSRRDGTIAFKRK